MRVELRKRLENLEARIGAKAGINPYIGLPAAELDRLEDELREEAGRIMGIADVCHERGTKRPTDEEIAAYATLHPAA